MKVSDHPALRDRRAPDGGEAPPVNIDPPATSIPHQPPAVSPTLETASADPAALSTTESGTVDEPQTSAVAGWSREPIADAPLDGSDVLVYWGDADTEGRWMRWKVSRAYDRERRCWAPGGKWIPAADFLPAPAEPPTHWLRPPDPTPDPVESEEGDAETEGAEAA